MHTRHGRHIPVVVAGAGPAGLAMSYQLTTAGVDHVVFERGEVANSWRTERWDSLRLLTPNWMTALPGHHYFGNDPGGFMDARETAGFLDAYRRQFDPPLYTGAGVRHVRRGADGYQVATDAGTLTCDAVVAATGGSSEARVPALAADLPARLEQLTALAYRRPSQLDPDGEILVVGASASGVQIADELRRHGRAVTLAVGEHIRMPRTYRGRDIYWWMHAIGQLDERYDDVDDIDRARRHASVQLIGTEERRDLDCNTLHRDGVRLVGRLAAIAGTTALCSGGLASLVANADLKQTRLLDRIDEFIAHNGLDGDVNPADPPVPTLIPMGETQLDLNSFSTLIWATGYRPQYPWLDPTAFDHRRRVVHDGGVANLPGLYLLGLPFMRRRRSGLISGIHRDATELFGHLRGYLDVAARERQGSRVVGSSLR
jgi:putative flavoprotein involved in K+ transport